MDQATITKCLATNIRNLRKQSGLTQSELAGKSGISLIFLQAIEAERKWISPATVHAIAQALEVHESRLFEHCFERESHTALESHASALGQKKSQEEKKKRFKKANFDHIPDDIFNALATTCMHQSWKWEFLRWVIRGFEGEGHHLRVSVD